MSRVALEPEHYPFFDYRRFTFSLGIAAANGVWLSGSTAVRFDAARKAMVVEGDLVDQARVIFEKMRLTLEAGGLGLRDIVRIVQYVTPRAIPDLPRLKALVADLVKGVAPAISVIVVKSLLRPEALIEIEAVASRDGRSKVEYLPTVSASDAPRAWSRADHVLIRRGLRRQDVLRAIELMAPTVAADGNDARGTIIQVTMPRVVDDGCGVQIELSAASDQHADVLFVSAVGDPRAGDIAAQCRDIYGRLGDQLSAKGADLDAVVKTTEFVTPEGLGAYRETAAVRRDVFAAPYPAATGVVCEALPAAGALIAVEAVAVRSP
ncbi:RidA family protein [Rhodoplanes sp. Z2-YC6860]|uniref:RidA family protein n=1 Tax=Rhodoplanes sp. Z2-YC6860 TaxID=674703 RepID=UPI00078D9AB4|nr:RidA family protein [Rhodoplanes sp. Z2-YC6860]AMN44020.1 endoribonuclease L-PSP [Rhodoplanes sp. Z2-YC6860]